MLISGFTQEQWDRYIEYQERIKRAVKAPGASPIPLKEFKQSYPHIPILKSYKGDLGDQYWGKWEKQTYKGLRPFVSWVCPDKLESLALKLGYSGSEELLIRVLK